MGACSSNANLTPEEAARLKAERDRSKQLEQQMTTDHHREQQVHKLLLLGAGESGKSTLFKQMNIIYGKDGKGYPDSERKTFIPIIHNNVITAMKTLLQHVDQFGGGLAPTSQNSRQLIEELKGDESLDEKLGDHTKNLWYDPAIQQTFENRSHFQLIDSSKYFFDKLDEISRFNYIPSMQDVLRSRVRTTGIVENEFIIDDNKFRMFDVGGQRNERKKWIHCFENVTAVLFVAAISEYDQVLYEDENTNRMVEALNLFEEICNSRWFRKTAMILFLNKRDLFADKIQRVSLRQFFPAFTGDEHNYDQCVEFIQGLFEDRRRDTEKTIYTHVTCATDTDNIRVVFNAVKDIVIKQSLTEAGLL